MTEAGVDRPSRRAQSSLICEGVVPQHPPRQKGAIEREHVELRRVLEKGTSFDGLTQRRLDLVLCHVNSYSRPARGDKSPVEVFEFIYGEGVAARLGLRRIPANEVTLTRKLLEIELPE